MKQCWLVTFLFLASSQVAARSVEICPTLPADSGLVWSYSEGPDFDICRAHAPGSEDQVFGVYLGNAPSFHPESAERIGKGKVGGRLVIWYRLDSTSSSLGYSRQTLLTLDRKWGYVAHIWLAADSEQQLLDRLSVLERITFKLP